jgi:hypothetical protein
MKYAVVIENKILDGIALVVAQGECKYDGNIWREHRRACRKLGSGTRGPFKVGEFPRIHEVVLS